MKKQQMNDPYTEKSFRNFKHNGIHFSFGEFGLSVIWGYASYTSSRDRGGFYDFTDRFTDSDDVEIFWLGNWPQSLANKFYRHFSTSYFPIANVNLDDFIWCLNTLQKFKKQQEDKTK